MLGPLALVLRRLRQQPSFTSVAIATLALGIGASTAIFSALDAALLRPLPYADPGQLYTLRTTMTNGRFTSGLVAGLELRRLIAATNNVAAVAAARREDRTLVGDRGADTVAAYEVSPGFFEMFGLPLAAGAGFKPEHHLREGPISVRQAVISHRLWRRMFNGDPSAVGAVLRTPTESLTVVGVAHAAFAEPAHADFWIAIPLHQNIGHMFDGYMRLRPGVTLDRVRGPMQAVMHQLGVEIPEQNRHRVFVATPMLETVVGDLKPILIVVFGATVLLMMLAAANVTNLMLARGTSRTREVAVRSALGAGRGRLLRELMLESLVLTAIGGACGVALAALAIKVLSAYGMADLPRLAAVTLDGRVLLFALAAMTVTGVFVGVLPAVSLLRTDIRVLLASDTRTSTGNPVTRRLLGGMIAAEIAVAIVLVAGAGRLVQRFADLMTIDSGFTSEDRLIASAVLPWHYMREAAQLRVFGATMRERLRPLGPMSIAVASSVPLGHEWDYTTFIDFVDGPQPDPQNRPNARWRHVSPDYFRVMGIRLVAGRLLQDSDDQRAPGAIVVNETFVRRFISPRNPIGTQVLLPGLKSHEVNGKFVTDPSTIVGVVADVRHASLGRAAEQTIYTSLEQVVATRQNLIIAGDDRTLAAVAPVVRQFVQGLDPRIAVEVTRLSALREASISRQRLGMLLMLLFGAAALMLAIVGVLGVIAYVTGQRLGEMALRLALGGTAANVFWLVMRHGAWLTVTGGAAGIMLAWATGRVMMRFVGESASTATAGASAGVETFAIAVSAALVIAAALAATALVARRAARIDPSRALRLAN
jgi:putative ABC transport system permease protein